MFSFLPSHEDTKWAITNKLESAGWWFLWRLRTMLESTPSSSVISTGKLRRLPPYSRKVRTVLSCPCPACTEMKERGWVSAGRRLELPSPHSRPHRFQPPLHRQCFRPQSPGSHTVTKLLIPGSSFSLVKDSFLCSLEDVGDSTYMCLAGPGS